MMEKNATWSNAEWALFLRLALGGTLLSGGIGAANSLRSHLKKLDTSVREQEKLEAETLKVPVYGKAKTAAVAGAAGLAAGTAGGVGLYAIIEHLTRLMRKQEVARRLQDAQEGYEEELLRAHQREQAKAGMPGVKSALLSPASPGESAGIGPWASWLLLAGVPLTWWLADIVARRGHDKLFPKAQKKLPAMDRPLVFEPHSLTDVRRRMRSKNEADRPSGVEEEAVVKEGSAITSEDEALAWLLPLGLVRMHPCREKQACLLEPVIAAGCHGRLAGPALLKMAGHIADITLDDRPGLDIVTCYAMLKSSAAERVKEAVVLEMWDCHPGGMGDAAGLNLSSDAEAAVVKTAAFIGRHILMEALQREGVATPERIKAAAALDGDDDIAAMDDEAVWEAVNQLMGSGAPAEKGIRPDEVSSAAEIVPERAEEVGTESKDRASPGTDRAPFSDEADAVMQQLSGGMVVGKIS